MLHLLHWLPVRQRVDFKVATLVYRSLSGTLPSYLADDCLLIVDARERRLYSPRRTEHCVRWLRWQSFCSCQPRTMKQFTVTSQRCGLIVLSVQSVTKDILFGQWRSVTTSIGHPEILLLTYWCLWRFRIRVVAAITSHWRKSSIAHNRQSPVIVQVDRLCLTLMVCLWRCFILSIILTFVFFTRDKHIFYSAYYMQFRMSVSTSFCLSVCHMRALYQNGWT